MKKKGVFMKFYLNNILEDAGVFGYQQYEKPLLTALITEDPILLVGEHGIAKTLLSEKLAQLLGYSTDAENKEFQAYDASKSLFEDVVGFPDPKKMKQGYIDYLNSPITIWDKKFILIDEISRANPTMQNKWLEVIRNRRVMGKKIPHLKYIFAAMNPLSYLGANPLDTALADRFAQIITIKNNFSSDDLAKIINTMHDDDCPGLNKATKAKQDTRLITLVNELKQYCSNIPKSLSDMATKFTIAFYNKLNELNLPISPRRASMLNRNIQIYQIIDWYYDVQAPIKVENFVLATQNIWLYPVIDDEPNIDILMEALYYGLAEVGLIKLDDAKIKNAKKMMSGMKASSSKTSNKQAQNQKVKSNVQNSNNQTPIDDFFDETKDVLNDIKDDFDIFLNQVSSAWDELWNNNKN